jgi:hypothetical protein
MVKKAAAGPKSALQLPFSLPGVYGFLLRLSASGQKQILRHDKMISFRGKDPDLAVMRLGSPVDVVLLSEQTAGQDPHDAAVTGDEDILVILLQKIIEEGLASLDHVGNGLDCLRGRKKFGKKPEDDQRKASEAKVLCLVVFSEIHFDQPRIGDNLASVYISEDGSGLDGPVQGAGVDGVKVNAGQVFLHGSGLAPAPFVQRLVHPALPAAGQVEIGLAVA